MAGFLRYEFGGGGGLLFGGAYTQRGLLLRYAEGSLK